MSAAPGGPETGELYLFTIATWVYTLHQDGIVASDEAIRTACDGIRAATDPTAGNAAAERLVAGIRETFPSSDPAVVAASATRLYGDRVKNDLGTGDRAERTSRIRKYHFSSHLPWLARIWERSGSEVRPGWLLVERVTDEVTAADPNPWNEVDETRHLPVSDFLVLWELDGCSSVHLSAPAPA